jgi:Methylase involved in ubiquinone/menaquinone biosynthesis
MEDHIIDPEKASILEKDGRYRIVSGEEIMAELERGDIVADIGSGTGFFADDMAKLAEKVYAVDFQEQMHEYYREKGVPENVELVNTDATDFEPDQKPDVAFLITSLHEVDIGETIENLSSVLREGGELFVVDWSSNSETDQVPAKEKLLTAKEASNHVSQHFTVNRCEERYDTYMLKAENA